MSYGDDQENISLSGYFKGKKIVLPKIIFSFPLCTTKVADQTRHVWCMKCASLYLYGDIMLMLLTGSVSL